MSAESRWRRADVLVVTGIVSVVATSVLGFALDALGAFGCLDAGAGGFFCSGGRGSTAAMWGLIVVPTLFDLAGVVVGVRRHSPSIVAHTTLVVLVVTAMAGLALVNA